MSVSSFPTVVDKRCRLNRVSLIRLPLSVCPAVPRTSGQSHRNASTAPLPRTPFQAPPVNTSEILKGHSALKSSLWTDCPLSVLTRPLVMASLTLFSRLFRPRLWFDICDAPCYRPQDPVRTSIFGPPAFARVWLIPHVGVAQGKKHARSSSLLGFPRLLRYSARVDWLLLEFLGIPRPPAWPF